jgi:hypothetical protein
MPDFENVSAPMLIFTEAEELIAFNSTDYIQICDRGVASKSNFAAIQEANFHFVYCYQAEIFI